MILYLVKSGTFSFYKSIERDFLQFHLFGACKKITLRCICGSRMMSKLGMGWSW